MPARDAAAARSYGLPLPAMGSVQRAGQGQASPVQHAIQSPVAADRTVRSGPVMRSRYGSSHTMLAAVGPAAAPLVRTAGAGAASIRRQTDTLLPGRVQLSEAALARAGSAIQGTTDSPSVAQRAPVGVVGSGPSVPTSDPGVGAPLPLRHALAATAQGQAATGLYRTSSSSAADVVAGRPTSAGGAVGVSRPQPPGSSRGGGVVAWAAPGGAGILRRHLAMAVTAQRELAKPGASMGPSVAYPIQRRLHVSPPQNMPVVAPATEVGRATQTTAVDLPMQGAGSAELMTAPVAHAQRAPDAAGFVSLQRADGIQGPLPVVSGARSQFGGFQALSVQRAPTSSHVSTAPTGWSDGPAAASAGQPGADLMPTLELVQRKSSSSSAAASPIHATLPRPGSNSFLQRAGDGASPTPSAPSVSANTQPGAGNNNGSSAAPDLERLANAVYDIIERRITVERESLGL